MCCLKFTSQLDLWKQMTWYVFYDTWIFVKKKRQSSFFMQNSIYFSSSNIFWFKTRSKKHYCHIKNFLANNYPTHLWFEQSIATITITTTQRQQKQEQLSWLIIRKWKLISVIDALTNGSWKNSNKNDGGWSKHLETAQIDWVMMSCHWLWQLKGLLKSTLLFFFRKR